VAVVVVMSVMVWRSVVMVIVMHVVVWRSVVVIMRGSSVGPIQTCMVPMTAMVATVMTMIHFYLNFSEIMSNEWPTDFTYEAAASGFLSYTLDFYLINTESLIRNVFVLI
jgi:hypothetical protein